MMTAEVVLLSVGVASSAAVVGFRCSLLILL